MTAAAGGPAESDDDEVARSEWHYLCERRASLRVRILSNRLYQQERQRRLETRESFVRVASLVAGSVAFTRIVPDEISKLCGLILVTGTSMSLVFGWGNKARDAAKRSNDWIALEEDVEKKGERRFEESDLDEWAARCNKVESGEPAPNLVLFERCTKRACESLGRGYDESKGPWGTKWRIPLLIP